MVHGGTWKINLKMQCMNKLSSLAAFGEKKNDKDMDRSDPNFNPTRSKKIHSVSTMKTYKSVAANFCDFMKQHYPSVKQIEQIETAHVRDYIESRHEQGYSNYSLSKELSCLNKLCHNENRDFWRLSEFGNLRGVTMLFMEGSTMSPLLRNHRHTAGQLWPSAGHHPAISFPSVDKLQREV